jgi:hypothetical protein
MDEHERRTAPPPSTAARRRAAQRGDLEAVLRLGEEVLTRTDALLDALLADLADTPPGYTIDVPADLAGALRAAREVRNAHEWRTRAAWERENLYETGGGLEEGVFFTLKDI